MVQFLQSAKDGEHIPEYLAHCPSATLKAISIFKPLSHHLLGNADLGVLALPC